MTGNGNSSNKRYSISASARANGRPANDSALEQDLLELQQTRLDGPARTRPNLQELSVEELEELLARKKAELARQQPNPTGPRANRVEPASARPKTTPSQTVNSVIDKVPSARFAPASLVVSVPKAEPPVVKKAGPLRKIGNLVGYTLEVLVVVAALGLAGNWLLQQAGINLNFFSPAQVADFMVAPSRPEGLFLSARAGGVIALPPTAVPATATPLPPTPTVLPDLSPVAIIPTATPAPTATPEGVLAVAPTPTPAIVQPVKQSLAEGAATPVVPPSPARRLIIPKIGVDTSVQEVTVNLGTWQVADFVAGHHQGTAMPGQPGNMVIAGHRDIRGSIFLRLNELQKGDEFKVVTDNGSYRYVITEVKEVAPTEISVLNPTIDPTATLITCTPVGLATRRLILKAALEK